MAAGSDSDDVTVNSRPKQQQQHHHLQQPSIEAPPTANGNKRLHLLSLKDTSRKQRKLDQAQSSPRRHPLAYLDVDLDPDSDHAALPSPLFTGQEATAATKPHASAQDALLPEFRPTRHHHLLLPDGHPSLTLEIDPLMNLDEEQQDKKPDVAAVMDHHIDIESANGLHHHPLADPLNRPHLQKPRLPFLKRTLDPPITTRQWAGQCRAVHESLSASAGFASSTTRINNPPTCKPFTRTTNPLIKFNFAYGCVEHRLVQQMARRRAWFFDDACPWCCPQRGQDDGVVKVQVTNVPDLVAHLRQSHTDFDFEPKRAVSRLHHLSFFRLDCHSWRCPLRHLKKLLPSMCGVDTTCHPTHYRLRQQHHHQHPHSLKPQHPQHDPSNLPKVSPICPSIIFTSPTALRHHQQKIRNRSSGYHQPSCFHQMTSTPSCRGKELAQQRQRQLQPQQHLPRWQHRTNDRLASRRHHHQPPSWTSLWRMRTNCNMPRRASCHRPYMAKACTTSQTCRQRGRVRRRRAAAGRGSASSRSLPLRRSRIFGAV